jgi:hypothetical protein
MILFQHFAGENEAKLKASNKTGCLSSEVRAQDTSNMKQLLRTLPLR